MVSDFPGEIVVRFGLFIVHLGKFLSAWLLPVQVLTECEGLQVLIVRSCCEQNVGAVEGCVAHLNNTRGGQ